MVRLWIIGFILLGGILLGHPTAEAQESTAMRLRFNRPDTGNLDSQHLSETWWFEGKANQRVSLSAVAIEGDLDTVIAVYRPDGSQLAANDDARFDDTDARLENIPLPQDGRYEVQVYREGLTYGQTSGQYQLALYEGFSIPIAIANDSIELGLDTGRSFTTAVVGELPSQDFYITFEGTMPSGTRDYGVEWRFHDPENVDLAWTFKLGSEGSWEIGLSDRVGRFAVSETGRYPDDVVPYAGKNARFEFRKQGDTFYVNVYEVDILQFTLPEGFEAPPIGDITVTLRGNIRENANEVIRLTMQDIQATAPYYLSETEIQQALPPTAEGERVYTINKTPLELMRELRTLRFAPEGGGVQAQFADAFILNDELGFYAYPLAPFQTFQNFVWGFQASVLRGNENTACGVIFRQEDAANFGTVLFTPGGQVYFLEYRDGNPTPTSLALYTPYIKQGIGEINHFIIVAARNTAVLFVNGRLIGSIPSRPIEGKLAVHLFVTEEISSYCLLNQGWVWQLENQ